MIGIRLQKLSGDEAAKLQFAESATLRDLREAVCNLESCQPWSFALVMDGQSLRNLPDTDLLKDHGIGDSAVLTLLKTNTPAVLTASDDSTAKIWDSSTGECQQTLSGHGSWVWSAVFSAV